ncbi:tetratricopeptide repeat protein [Thalassospira xiamenensis]|uniref:tetratricopeptide repeat protein n=1 Tax=Thalassospira xiamenensis TaxID=220697 RepID=UPI003AA92ABF
MSRSLLFTSLMLIGSLVAPASILATTSTAASARTIAQIPAPVTETAEISDDMALIDEYWHKSYYGDAMAQRLLAIVLSYHYANDGEVDKDERMIIVHLLECAALQGDKPAIDHIQGSYTDFDISETGKCYYNGAGYTADDPKPADTDLITIDEDTLRARAMNGHAAAQFALAEYLESQFLFFDAFDEAEGWYNCAAKQDYSLAIEVLADGNSITTYPESEPCPFTNRTMDANGKVTERFASISIEPDPAPASASSPASTPAPMASTTAPATDTEQLFADALAAYYGDGMPQDFPRAMELARKAADQNHAGAINLIGVMYLNGSGVAPDATEAAYHYRRAADLGDVSAMVNLADCYLHGIGVDVSLPRAREWYEKAASDGDAYAQYNLSAIYQSGAEGIEPDPVLARKWMKLAAENGDPDAPYYYGHFLEYGIGGPEDPAGAIVWYQKAVELDDTNGFAAMGRMHYYGEYTTEDLELAWYYLSIAAARDHVEAKTWIEVAAPSVTYEQRARASAQVTKYLAEKGAQ